MRGPGHLVVLIAVSTTVGCAAATPAPVKAPRKTADGLELVAGQRRGALFIKPDHGIGAHHRYYLSQVLLTYERDSNRFSEAQEQRMREYVEDATIAGMIEGGSVMVTGPGPCVLSMGIGLVDVELTEPNGTGASTSMLTSWGGVTLVLDLRDSVSGEPLLRYGRRIGFPGGIQWQDDLPPWRQVRTTLDELLLDQRKTLESGVPISTVENTACIPPDPEEEPADAAPTPTPTP